MAFVSAGVSYGVVGVGFIFSIADLIFRQWRDNIKGCYVRSSYQSSSGYVFGFQLGAIVLGAIASFLRVFTFVPTTDFTGLKSFHKIEGYRIQKLQDWRDAPLPFHFRYRSVKKLAYIITTMILLCGIGLQWLIIILAKLVYWLSLVIGFVLLSPFWCTCRLALKLIKGRHKNHSPEPVVENTSHDDLKAYLLHVEGTLQSDEATLAKWVNQTRRWIVKGQTMEPTILHDFLRSFSKPSLGFPAATCVYSSVVPEILIQKVANCWSLTLVTLATVIRVAFRNSGQEEAISRIMKATDKGFKYARFADKKFPVLDGSPIMITAAKKVWDTVDLYGNWMNEDLDDTVGDSLAVIRKLEDIAKRCLEKFQNEDPTEDPADWPLKVIAADCLHKITGTISSTYRPQHNTGFAINTNNLFDKLQKDLADTMGACLASLPRAILMHCYSGKFGSREEKVRKAATILGEIEGILKWLEDVGGADKYPSIIEYVDNWQSWRN